MLNDYRIFTWARLQHEISDEKYGLCLSREVLPSESFLMLCPKRTKEVRIDIPHIVKGRHVVHCRLAIL